MIGCPDHAYIICLTSAHPASAPFLSRVCGVFSIPIYYQTGEYPPACKDKPEFDLEFHTTRWKDRFNVTTFTHSRRPARAGEAGYTVPPCLVLGPRRMRADFM